MATEGHSRTPEELCHLLKSVGMTLFTFYN